MNFMKKVFQSEMSRKFNTNILRLALNMNEDRIAAFLVAKYPVSIDEKVINFALANKNLIFIQ